MIPHINMQTDNAWREFHVSRQSRDQYQFDQSLFATNGNVLLANFTGARIFAQNMNDKRDLLRHPERTVRASTINAMGLLDEVLHHVVARYREEINPDVLDKALAWLETNVGRAGLDATLLRFTDEFPPIAVYRGELGSEEYLNGETNGISHRQVALEELLMLWLSNMNPALKPYAELFDDSSLAKQTAYATVITELGDFFKSQPPYGPDNQSLIEMLRAPALAVPDSLTGQLQFILSRWGTLAGTFFQRLLTSMDFIKEEEKPVFFGPGPSIVPTYGPQRGGRAGTTVWDEPERFSPDKDWMPQVVMMAKNIYVWMDQLSRKYSRPIKRMDEIPDEELDTLASQGFTALWLIGLWERSQASQRIKQMCGNEDAVASAYSLHDYDIAYSLGGPDAMHNLRVRAGQRGIRMASDMVPNHMAIDSRWVTEHPDWFLSLDYSPFPTYSFNGVNLSRDDRVGIYLEDHYYSREDAAVVFKRVDHSTGSEKYVYHGNDGTSMPWNDTAQLNYLNPALREGVIQTILHVARQFPIIRFDAAMTLAKRHYQRLWYPEPGTGGAIPSRAEHGLTAEEFNAAMPEEFWREVVDRVATELPDTLLLAEAFWMMEGYFVRTLGMHRVYNSAFMNMLRDEENMKYREVLKNTLEFDPDILKRFVNFMNNPDEKTAVEQFGKDGKYFGICTMMATLPGLPMFGHGQIEGFAEKYGMEYQRAYWQEEPDQHLIERHEREIFPLFKRRYLFSEVENFLLYDFWNTDGSVIEDVYAYSNRQGNERALVVFHNKYADARGWIRTSVGSAVKGPGSKQIVQKTLGEGLGLRGEDGWFTIFRDNVTGLEYIRHSRELCEQGLYVEVAAYESHVFLDFQERRDNAEGHYARLTDSLNGRGVPSLDIALLEILLEPVHTPFRELVNADLLRRLIQSRHERLKAELVNSKPLAVPPSAAKGTPKTKPAMTPVSATFDDTALWDEMEEKTETFIRALQSFYASENGTVSQSNLPEITEEIINRLKTVLELPDPIKGEPADYLRSGLNGVQQTWATLLSWVIVHDLAKVVTQTRIQEQSRTWLDEWLLGLLITRELQSLGLDQMQAEHSVSIIKTLTAFHDLLESSDEAELKQKLALVFSDPEAHRVLAINSYNGVLWLNQESFDQFLWWLFTAIAVLHNAEGAADKASVEKLQNAYKLVVHLQQAAAESGYQVEKLLELI